MSLTSRASSSAARSSLRSAAGVLASPGQPFSEAAIDLAASLAGGGAVRVVTVARIHGFAFGLQHPGLMPNKKEKDAASQIVSDAIRALHKRGLAADGEVAITRGPGAAFARTARSARTVTHVVIDAGSGWAEKAEGMMAGRYVRMRLRIGVTAVSGGVVATSRGRPGSRRPARRRRGPSGR